MTNTEYRNAGAWWIEIDVEDDAVFACFDVMNGQTVAINITDASFGGEIEVAGETGAVPEDADD